MVEESDPAHALLDSHRQRPLITMGQHERSKALFY
jgi:hypothetical protein